MSEFRSDKRVVPITFSSSARDDVWHDDKAPEAYEGWHFDALSDDGRQALIVSFYDNYPLSPRYHQNPPVTNGQTPTETCLKCPAVSLIYSVDGKVVLNAINEFNTNEFSSKREGINCAIGPSWFKAESAEYGTGYVVNLDLIMARKNRLRAQLEWLSIEADMLTNGAENPGPAMWNIVSLRSDVSGRITVTGADGETINVFHIRGTGSHDHFRNQGPIDVSLAGRCWGRGHFVDSTAVFQCVEAAGGECSSTLRIVRNGEIEARDVKREINGSFRSRFGLKVPRELIFTADDGLSLKIVPVRPIESGFCDVKIVARMGLYSAGEKLHETMGIMAILAPGRLRGKLIRRLSGLKIGVNGRPPLF